MSDDVDSGDWRAVAGCVAAPIIGTAMWAGLAWLLWRLWRLIAGT